MCWAQLILLHWCGLSLMDYFPYHALWGTAHQWIDLQLDSGSSFQQASETVLWKLGLRNHTPQAAVGMQSITPGGRSGHSEAVFLQLEFLLGIALKPGKKKKKKASYWARLAVSKATFGFLNPKGPPGFSVSTFSAQVIHAWINQVLASFASYVWKVQLPPTQILQSKLEPLLQDSAIPHDPLQTCSIPGLPNMAQEPSP